MSNPRTRLLHPRSVERRRSLAACLCALLAVGCAGAVPQPMATPSAPLETPSSPATTPVPRATATPASESTQAPTASAPAASPTTPPSPTATLDPLGSRTEAQIAMPGGPDVPIDAFGSMWFLTPDAPVIGVTRLDPATNEIVATIGGGSAACEAMGATDDAIWMCTTKGLARIDPETNEVTSQLEFPTGEAFGYLPYDGSSLWALSGQGTLTGDLVRIDPAANRITGTYPLGFGAAFMSYGEGAIWLSDSAAGVLWRFDPETQELTEHVSDLPQPGPSAVGAGSIWLALRADDERRPVPTEVTLVRIDPTSGEIEAEFATGGTVQGGLVHVADDQVLVRASAPFLTYIDVATNEMTDTLQVDRAGGSVTVAHGSIWATSTDYSTVWRLAR